MPNFEGQTWLKPVARCVLQAVYYLHTNKYAHQDIHLDNVFCAVGRDELVPQQAGVLHFKLGDLGVARVFGELDGKNTLAQWMLPPEAIDPTNFGPFDHRIDIFHIGLMLLQLAYSKTLQFKREEILGGVPRQMALALPPPLNTALEKALRRHVQHRTSSALELWRDLSAPA
jgi:serine/threonine-protein kinase